MSSVTNPRGPLPARVYWARRVVALGLALGLVFGASRLVAETTSGDEGSTARPAAADVTSSLAPGPTLTALPSQPPAEADPGREQEETKQSDEPEPEKTPLAAPTGPCQDDDVKVSPSVAEAHAYDEVSIALELTTLEEPACTWEVSAESVVLRITSGSDPIWTTQDCQEAVPDEAVVVRKDHPAAVDVTWSGLRSDEGCTRSTPWAEPGYYHVSAAAYGADPADFQFQLGPPVPSRDKTKAQRDRSGDRAGDRDAEDRSGDENSDRRRDRSPNRQAGADRNTDQERHNGGGRDADRDGHAERDQGSRRQGAGPARSGDRG